MAASSQARWMRGVAYVAFALGAVLAVLSLVQLVTDVHVLDDPWTGLVGFWLLAFILRGVAARTQPAR
ncbi:MAG: hypothetical protein AAF089_06055 [Bacteroidota bacterium]